MSAIRLAIPHPSSLSLIRSRGLTRLPSQLTVGLRSNIHLHLLLCGRHKIWGNRTEGRRGFKKSLYQLGTSTLQLSPFHSSSSSVYHALDFSLKFFIAVELWLRPFLTHSPPTFWYRWVVLLSIFLLWLHTTFPVWQELIRTFKGRLNLLWGLRTLRPSKTFRRLTKKAGFAEQNTFLDV